MEKDPETFAIIGAAMEVHRELGRGYQNALALEFQERGIPFKAEVELPVRNRGKLLSCGYRADFVCFKTIVVETKAVSQLTSADEAQLINELKATGLWRGPLLNFGGASLGHKRPVFGPSENLCKSANLWTKSICKNL
ncbi:MAG: GxxExxY protein [Verrucomicrobiota bacterium]|nr:GxxExxY protein [Chthoniobacterales bacterium]MDQ3413636.1 GxxExxY protein [Verrucomicrobiota bacterium]